MASLIQLDYFDHFVGPKLGPAKESEANAHNSFKLKGVNEGGIPMTGYFKMAVIFLELKVPKFGFLFAKSPSDLLDQDKNNKLSGIVGWNLIN